MAEWLSQPRQLVGARLRSKHDRDVRYRRAEHTASRAIAGETILLDLRRKVMYGLNETAAFLWQALATGEDLDRLGRLTADSEGSIDVSVLESFCEELSALGLVRPAEPGEPSSSVDVSPPGTLSPPRILWQEEVRQIAATCAFLPGENPICFQVPMT